MSQQSSALFRPMTGTGWRIGFGCTDLPVWSRRRSLSMLACAYDLGVRHFDVARMYSWGEAERMLGVFLRGRRSEVSLTTKFGLEPEAWTPKTRLKQTVREAVAHAPPLLALWRRLRQHRAAPAPPAAPAAPVNRFTLADAQRNLEASLRLLQTDYVDIWLLHEADAADAAQPALIDFLTDQQRRGTIRSFGIGSASWRVQRDVDGYPPPYSVVQFNNNPLRPTLPRVQSRAGTFAITHGMLRAMPDLRGAMRPPHLEQFAKETGIDLGDDHQLAALLLRWALKVNADGGVLFGSSKRRRIAANLAAMRDPRVTGAAVDAFGQLVARLRS